MVETRNEILKSQRLFARIPASISTSLVQCNGKYMWYLLVLDDYSSLQTDPALIIFNLVGKPVVDID